MKNFFLLIMPIVLYISCAQSHEEKMLYDYQQKKMDTLGYNLKDLDFKIEKIEKVADIKVLDSMTTLKNEFISYFKNESNSIFIDTLSFKNALDLLNKEIIYFNIKIDTVEREETGLTVMLLKQRKEKMQLEVDEFYEQNEVRNPLPLMFAIYDLNVSYDKYAEYPPDSILATKYRAKYSLKNPMLSNKKQAFEKLFYTNSLQTEFVNEVPIN